MLSTLKPLAEWTFEEVVALNQSSILDAIKIGDLNSAVWQATELAVRWRHEKSLQPFKPE